MQSKEQQEAYQKGFLLGYQAGYRDCLRKQDQTPSFEDDIPLEACGISGTPWELFR